jgi:signal transduction histidine kinase
VRLYADLEARVSEASAALEQARLAGDEARREIEERRRAQELLQRTEQQLRQAQKMEAVGQLAGGIAHDFNNLLSVVLGTCELMRLQLAEGSVLREDVEEIRQAGERAAALTRQLLAFGRKQVLDVRVIDLNEVVLGTQRMMARIIGSHIELETRLSAREPVHADAAHLEQVLVNLVVNARDAMPARGRLTIETADVALDEDEALALGAPPGAYVELRVSDTGAGMPPEVQARVFEPFFTTKERGKGTGLGLAIVYGIVKQHGGMIHVYSEVAHGTTFKIYLPIVERIATTVGRKVEGPLRGGHETVLLAEDHDMVRQVARTILEHAGYRVLIARDGKEAIDIYDRQAAEIQLVLLDAVMPVVSGHAVFEHITARQPELPILVASGYASGVFPEEFLARNGQRFISKPYDSDELLRRVRDALDAPAGP